MRAVSLVLLSSIVVVNSAECARFAAIGGYVG
jgi:hypothetical protein